MRNRNIKKQIWLNEEEEYLLKLKASKAGINSSEFIRLLIKDSTLKEKPGEEFYNAMKDIRLIGNNLNQIARIANSTGNINSSYYSNEANKLNDFMIKIKKEFL